MAEFEAVGGGDFKITIGGQRLLGLLFRRTWWNRGDPDELVTDVLLCAVLLYGKGYERVACHKGPPTMILDSRSFVLPEDRMVYVVGPELKLQRVDVRAEEVEHHFQEDTLNEYVRSNDWASKVQPVLDVHMWREDATRNGKESNEHLQDHKGTTDGGDKLS